MPKPNCSVEGCPNEAIVVLTDFSDGTTICPCPVHFDELVDYVVSITEALEQLFAIPAGEVPQGSAEAVEPSSDDIPLASEPETPTTEQKRSGRSSATSAKVGTDDDPESEVNDQETANVAPSS